MKSKRPEKGKSSLRKGRFSEQGQYYFVTTCCCKKRKVFANAKNVAFLFETIEWMQDRKYIDLHFCIAMPDHVHFIFQLTGEKSLSEVMKSIKQFTARRIKANFKHIKNVWQTQYYDHLIRGNENLLNKIKYCLNNSIRAGIVDNPHEYPFWISKYKL
jgi:putative transposase